MFIYKKFIPRPRGKTPIFSLDWSTIGNFPIRLFKVVSKAGVVEIRLFCHALLYLDKGVELAPAVFAAGVAFGEA
jgi:hypothetical protein